MKRLTLLGATLLLLGACDRFDGAPAPAADSAPEGSAPTLVATIDPSAPAASRTELDETTRPGEGLVRWQTYDNVGLCMLGAFDRRVQEIADSLAADLSPSQMYVTPEFYLIQPSDAGSTTASFRKAGDSAPSVAPEPLDDYVAVYPYAQISGLRWTKGGRTLTLSLVAQQQHPMRFGELGVMVAKTTGAGPKDIRLNFKNIFSIVRFSLTGGDRLASIRFRSNSGEAVAGAYTLDIAGDDYTTTRFAAEGDREITLVCNTQLTAEAQSFSLVVPARTYTQGFTVTFTADDGRTMTRTIGAAAGKTLLRNTIHAWPAVAFAPEASAAPEATALWQEGTGGTVTHAGFDELPGATDLGEGANCFIVSQPGNYKFRPTRGDGSPVEGLDREVYFTAGDTRGNAVIAATVNGQIVWSWHIWYTEPPAEKQAAEGFTILDRNLGATSATPGDHHAYGLYYQWGRKDPFIGASGPGDNGKISGASETTAFGTLTAEHVAAEGFAFNVVNNNALPTECVAYTIRHPTTFIRPVTDVNGSGTTTWFNDDVEKYRGLWGDASGGKSPYDPCPAGYRVPSDSQKTWAGFTKTDLTADKDTFGATLNDAFYPCAGWRDGTGVLKSVGVQGKYQSAAWNTAATPQAYLMQITAYTMGVKFTTSFSTTTPSNIAGATTVRCVKIAQ